MRASFLEMEAASKAGQAVEPLNEIHSSDCAVAIGAEAAERSATKAKPTVGRCRVADPCDIFSGESVVVPLSLQISVSLVLFVLLSSSCNMD